MGFTGMARILTNELEYKRVNCGNVRLGNKSLMFG